jgi:hypothetical protein
MVLGEAAAGDRAARAAMIEIQPRILMLTSSLRVYQSKRGKCQRGEE